MQLDRAVMSVERLTPNVLPIRLLEVDIGLPIRSLVVDGSVPRRYFSALILVRLHRAPLGTVYLPSPDRLIRATDCAAAIDGALRPRINEHLRLNAIDPIERLGVEGITVARHMEAGTRDSVPFASVVVASHDRPDSLRECLTSLMRLNYPDYEVVVVLNAPPAHADYAKVRAEFPHTTRVHWVHEPKPGACRARNLGIERASGEIIAFSDDDVVHDPDWLYELVRAVRAGPRVGCATGLAYPRELETPSQLWFEQYGGFGAGFRRRLFDFDIDDEKDPLYPYRPGLFGVGTNMAFRAEVIRELGGFDPALGPGTAISSGEDYALFWETLRRGYQIAYEPGAMVYHRHRPDFESLKKQVLGYAVGYSAALTKTLVDHPWTAWRLARQLPRGLAAFVGAKQRYGKRPEFPSELGRGEIIGMLLGPAYLMLHTVAP